MLNKRTLLANAALLAATAASNATAGPDGLRERMLERISAEARRHNVPGIAIACIEDGRASWIETVGVEDARTGDPVTPDTVFNVGSVSKVVAAWGVMRLVEDGALTLDDPIADRLSRWRLPGSEHRDGVTLRRILSHTAGLSLHGYPGFPPGSRLPTLEESLNGATGGRGRVEIEHEPGTRFQYSGGGYTIAQLAIEEATGRSFAEYMRTEVLRPLGMNSSEFGWTRPNLRAAAAPHDHSGAAINEEHFTALAAAGLNTTLDDLSRFVVASMPKDERDTGGVLPADTVRSMQLPEGPSADGGGPIRVTGALGYQVMDFPGGVRIVGHGGTNTGWEAFIAIEPRSRNGLVLMANGSNGQRAMRPALQMWISSLQDR